MVNINKCNVTSHKVIKLKINDENKQDGNNCRLITSLNRPLTKIAISVLCAVQPIAWQLFQSNRKQNDDLQYCSIRTSNVNDYERTHENFHTICLYEHTAILNHTTSQNTYSMCLRTWSSGVRSCLLISTTAERIQFNCSLAIQRFITLFWGIAPSFATIFPAIARIAEPSLEVLFNLLPRHRRSWWVVLDNI